MTGYQIEYQKQTSFFFREVPGDNYTEKRRALVSREIFAKMLNAHNYVVYTARLTEMAPDLGIEVITDI
ncbi:MAG TPA: hypothetical protein H9931_12085 [Candidatus Enterocloster excrementigallinarum]|uniref:Uncharacterized protein n=1 Tax=Candidatus Enterocloster excrementigallinarum TaxID=2838558 RepID=A0A9D2PW08_9FIRM|nr:hypothetical protein [Candidatus Enterocloster excrementigallinarum]